MSIDTDISKKKIVEFLRTLDELEFFDLLYSALEGRKEDEKTDGNWHIETYVIGHSISTSCDPIAYTEILARPKINTDCLLPESKQNGFTETGRCPLCKTIISASEKLVNCPICNTEVECT